LLIDIFGYNSKLLTAIYCKLFRSTIFD